MKMGVSFASPTLALVSVCDVEAISSIFNCIHIHNEVVVQRLVCYLADALDWQLGEEIAAQIQAKFTTGQAFVLWMRGMFDRACSQSSSTS